ncbi:MAG: MFS transporter small subunit [Gammaproteobacteria bacterium]
MKSANNPKSTPVALLLLFWLYVAAPLSWGVWSTLKKAMALFN